jgi:DMSO reductase anchor subunit
MTSLPKSTYLRLLENRCRPIARYSPDYPLAFFIFLSRFSFGVSVVSGILQISAYLGKTVVVNTVASLGCLLLAIAISVTHLGAPKGFMGMLRNICSRLTWEIGLSGALLLVLILNLLFLSLDMAGNGLTVAMGWTMILIAPSALLSSALAYQFLTHPSWNTNLLAVISLLSGLTLGFSFTCVAAQVVEGGSFPQSTRAIPLILGLLIFAELSVGYGYIRYLKGFLYRTVHDLLWGKSSILFWTYMSVSFALPLLIILRALLRGGLEFLPSVALAIALLFGVYLERILFFSIEKPIYFFYYMGERGEQMKEGRGSTLPFQSSSFPWGRIQNGANRSRR